MNARKHALRAVAAHVILLRSLCAAVAACTDDGYSMYVWSQGFDPAAPDCGGVYPIGGDKANPTCFRNNWQDAEARAKLWASCFVPGRQVSRIFVGGIKSHIENNGYDASGSCDQAVVDLLTEARQFGVRVYALFADSQVEFAETTMALYPKQFNDNCGTDEFGFDGVAINNEAFANFRDCGVDYTAERQDHLDKLQLAADNAAPLPLHFSISWNWDCCDCSSATYTTRDVSWPAQGGSTKSVVAHMVDIVDSMDVQTAFAKSTTMADRSTPPYNYWNAKLGKSSTSKMYALAYTNPTNDCRTSFSPHAEGSAVAEEVECSYAGTLFTSGNPRTEVGMFEAFDFVEAQLSGIKGGIHYLNGVFSTGITDGWPAHTSNPTPSCGPATPTTAPPTASPTTAHPSSSPTSKPTYPSIEKFLCHNKPKTDEEICSTGEPVAGSDCTAENDPCGRGGKVCRLATCENTSGTPPPTPFPVSPSTPAPVASCLLEGNPCPADRSECCSGKCSGGQNKVCT